MQLLDGQKIAKAVRLANAAYKRQGSATRLKAIPEKEQNWLIHAAAHLTLRLEPHPKEKNLRPSKKILQLIAYRKTIGRIYDDIAFNWGRTPATKDNLSMLDEGKVIPWRGTGFEAEALRPAIKYLRVAIDAIDDTIQLVKREQHPGDPWIPFLRNCIRAFQDAGGRRSAHLFGRPNLSDRKQGESFEAHPFVIFVHALVEASELVERKDIEQINNLIREKKRWASVR